MELYKKYRPRKLEDVVGQPEAVEALGEFIRKQETPQALLFTGPSGVGKTTIARIVARAVGAVDKVGLFEVNSAEARNLEDVRAMAEAIKYRPLGGKSQVWIMDEVHQLSKRQSGGDAQSAMLQVVEEAPPYAYFFLCTTDPQQLLRTLRGRCTPIPLAPLSPGTLKKLVADVAEKEGEEVSDAVLEKLALKADGSAREALVLLGKVLCCKGDKARLAVLQVSEERERDARDLCRLLLNGARWGEVSKMITALVNFPPEDVRRDVLGWFYKVLLGGGPKANRAAQIINSFRDNWNDSGKAGLAASCWEVVSRKE